MGFDDNTTYITERTASTRSRRSRGGRGLGALATAGAAGAGLAALASRNRSHSRSRSRRRGDETTVLSSRPDSRSRVTQSQFTESYLSDEKYNDRHKGSTWKDKVLGVGAAVGGIFAIKSLFGRKKDSRRAYTETLTGSDISYGRPLGQSEVTQTDLSRLEEGRAPDSPARNQDWRRVEEREAAQAAAMGASPMRGHRPARSGGSIDSFDSRTSFNDHPDSRPLREESSYGVKDGIMTLGAIGFLKHTWNKRKNKKEDARIEEMKQQDIEEEKMARANSNRRRFTGDGALPRRHNGPPSTIYSETEISGMTPSVARPHGGVPPPMPPMTSSAGPSVLRPTDNTVLSDSGSEAYVSPGGHSHRRHRNSAGAAALAGGAAAVAASSGSPSRRRSSRDESIVSPPVSVKVKMHNDGRHVTLRRLNEEEAAAERDARRRERQRRNRNGSMSSLSQLDGDRWRRTEALEAQQAAEMGQAQGGPPPPPLGAPLQMPEPYIPPPPPGPPPNFGNNSQRPGTQTNLPPPPPIPHDASILSSPGGTQVYGTETDVSNYDSNRRRRRAERAQAKQARSGGSRVEFS